ncbi:MAG TPA: hypothetical protein VEW03_11915, partial [Longimicrobiaceae bacterium]|nr:hypothetical protein [Longimicrobiaceae bacterium]
LLEALLRCSREAGFPARLLGASAALRYSLLGHPVAAYLAEAGEGEDGIFTSPDLHELGFQPSLR